jgi:CelD/BcsL family acetyltransferase involved in cellulose biosynthesis
LARAELAAQWVEQFQPRSPFMALVVKGDGRFLAALPLCIGRTRGILRTARLPGGPWSMCGDLLLDERSDVPAVLDRLIDGIRMLPCDLVRLDDVRLEAPRWQALLAAARRHGCGSMAARSAQVGQVDIDGTWRQYQAGWSRNHRRAMQKAVQRSDAAGGALLRVVKSIDPGEIETHLRRGFDCEDRSWKGREGTSVLRSRGIFDFYLRQARQLACWGQLRLAFLENGGRTIAFEYAPCAKNVYYSTKVGYDESFAQLTPGQHLRYRLLERFFEGHEVRLVDFAGILSDATGKWITRTEPIGRIVLAPRRVSGRLALWAYRTLWPRWKRLAGRRCDGSPSELPRRETDRPARQPEPSTDLVEAGAPA